MRTGILTSRDLSISHFYKPYFRIITSTKVNSFVTRRFFVFQGMFIVTFPYTVVEGGYWALFSMIIVAYICCYTGKVLVQCLYEENAAGIKERVRHSYGDVAECVWGKRFGGKIVNLAQLIELLMTCILYVLLCGDLMIGSFPDTALDLSSWIMLCSALLLPCAFLKNLRHVSWLSFWCTVAHMFINAIILLYCFIHAKEWRWSDVQIKIDIWTFPISLGIVIFSYTSQIFLPTLEGNLTDRSKFGCMMHWTHFSAALFKFLFSYIGFLTWGMATKEVITNNLPNHGLRIIVNLFLVAKALLSYPLPYFAAADLLEKQLFAGKPSTIFPSCFDAAGVLKIWGLVLRLGLVVLTLLMAIFIPHFNILMGLIGSITGNMLSLVWPSYFHLRIKGPQLRWYQKAFDVFIILLGFVCAGLGLYYSSHALARAFQGFEPRPFQGKYNIPVQSPKQYST